jgi:hypothetical protein
LSFLTARYSMMRRLGFSRPKWSSSSTLRAILMSRLSSVAFIPGQLGEPIQVSHGYRVFSRRGVHPCRDGPVLARLPSPPLRASFLSTILARYSSSSTVAFIGLSQLLFDGFELLSQIVFPLALVHVSLDLGLDLVTQLQNFQLVMQQLGDGLEAFGGVLYLQHLLLFIGGGVDRGRRSCRPRCRVP